MLRNAGRRARRRSSGPSVAPAFPAASAHTASGTSTEQLRALTLAQDYAANFAAVRDRGSCLLLVGGPGTGKTHLACAILSRIIGDGYSGLFLTASEGLRLIRSTYSQGADRTEIQVLEVLTSPDLLVLDEVGFAIGNGTTRRAMLFDQRLFVVSGDQAQTLLELLERPAEDNAGLRGLFSRSISSQCLPTES